MLYTWPVHPVKPQQSEPKPGVHPSLLAVSAAAITEGTSKTFQEQRRDGTNKHLKVPREQWRWIVKLKFPDGKLFKGLLGLRHVPYAWFDW